MKISHSKCYKIKGREDNIKRQGEMSNMEKFPALRLRHSCLLSFCSILMRHSLGEDILGVIYAGESTAK